ncbi:N-lysine methyltransferase KMT5A-like [Saccostrea cucullata]|uniref:N-lysine methyltransferase KMT5A-like n=1 Tax=Saccostrea cuccullata TaxID=36930 RepID=UPI002ECFD6D3
MDAGKTKRSSVRHEEISNAPSALEAHEDAVKHIKLQKDKAGCEVRPVNDIIGKGVFALKEYKKREFILEYDGKLISYEEGTPDCDLSELRCPVAIRFHHIDATFSKRIGRYVNDAAKSNHENNAEMVQLYLDGRPYLALFATRYIKPGEEIRYDYGVKDLPWRLEKIPQVQKKSKQIASGILFKLNDHPEDQR